MDLHNAVQWLAQGERRLQILLHFDQPLTTKQIAQKHRITFDSSSSAVSALTVYLLVRCLNSRARRSRLFWMTWLGQLCQRHIRTLKGTKSLEYDFPIVDWELYGWVCFSHRTAILKAMRGQMQPVEIRRRAVQSNSSLRMSANNCRDIIKQFVGKGIVRPVAIHKKAHLRYETTDVGELLQQLLFRAHESPDHCMNKRSGDHESLGNNDQEQRQSGFERRFTG